MQTTPSNIAKANFRTRALVTFIKEAFFQLDELAHLKKSGHTANISAALFREMCGVIKEFDADLLEQYFDILISLSIKAETNKRVEFTEAFAIAEANSRKKFIAKMRVELTLAANS